MEVEEVGTGRALELGGARITSDLVEKTRASWDPGRGAAGVVYLSLPSSKYSL